MENQEIEKLLKKYSAITKAKNDNGIYCSFCKLDFTNMNMTYKEVKKHMIEHKNEKRIDEINDLCNDELIPKIRDFRNKMYEKYYEPSTIKKENEKKEDINNILSCINIIISRCNKINIEYEPNILFNITMKKVNGEWYKIEKKLRDSKIYFETINTNSDTNSKKFKKRIL